MTLGARSQKSLDRAVCEFDDLSAGVATGLIDLTDDRSVEAFFGGMERVDHLVVTASPGGSSTFGSSSLEAAHGYMEGKFWKAHRTVHHGHDLIPADGSILLLSGGLAQRPSKGRLMVTYAFSATEALGRALAVEIAPRRVNAIRPGTIDTPTWSVLAGDERQELMQVAAERLPSGRVGKPEDVGVVGVMLMLSSHITGVVLDVNGGVHLADPF